MDQDATSLPPEFEMLSMEPFLVTVASLSV